MNIPPVSHPIGVGWIDYLRQNCRSNAPTPRHARQPGAASDPHRKDGERRPWNPEGDAVKLISPTRPRMIAQEQPRPAAPWIDRAADPKRSGIVPSMLPEPETRPITQEQLVAEVKGIYAGLCLVEAKCVEIDNFQSHQKCNNLSNERWMALISLHRSLLHEHHDFFLASQNPSDNSGLRRLASKHAMLARLWRHGTHSSLKLLKHGIPNAREYKLYSVYLAYSMIAMLCETTPVLEETWVRCLGDLGRYRMAIEEEDLQDSEVWTIVARQWHNRALEGAPATVRPCREAISVQFDVYKQVYLYTMSFCMPTAFHSPRESVLALFNPMLEPASTQLSSIDIAFVKTLTALFSDSSYCLQECIQTFLDLLYEHTRPWLSEIGYIGITLASSISEYGTTSPLLSSLSLLPLATALPILADATDTEKPKTPSQSNDSIPEWAFPPIFIFMLVYVELAGRYYQDRRKWYFIAMAPSNLCFPWLVEYDRVSPILTMCVFAFALYPTWGFTMIDYDDLRPPPLFYVFVAIGGFGTAATISALCQGGGMASTHAASGGNPFSIYLLFSMTLSMILCGRSLAAYRAWMKKKTARASDAQHD